MDKAIFANLFESMEHTITYYSLKVAQSCLLDAPKPSSPSLEFKELDQAHNKPHQIKRSAYIKWLSFELDLEKEVFVYSTELFLKCFEAKEMSYFVVNQHLWLLFKACLYLAQSILEDATWNLSDFAVIVGSSEIELSGMSEYILKDLLDYKILITDLQKTYKFLEKVADFC